MNFEAKLGITNRDRLKKVIDAAWALMNGCSLIGDEAGAKAAEKIWKRNVKILKGL